MLQSGEVTNHHTLRYTIIEFGPDSDGVLIACTSVEGCT